jgi:hypothetical protein
MAYPATPKTWTAGDILTAAQMNAELRDALLAAFPLNAAGLSAAWTSYTPTLAQGATGNISKTVTYARYTRIGRLIIVQGYLDVTGPGTAAAGVTVTLPVTAASSLILQLPGTAFILDTSASLYYPGFPRLSSTTVLAFMPAFVSIGVGWISLGQGGGVAAANFGAALASGDVVNYSAIYESAS